MQNPALRSVYKLTEISHLPPSFDNNPVLYGAALMSVMSISFMSLGMIWWMVRDIWRDRKIFHPKTLLFKFRQMIAVISTVAFIRCLPEMLYLQMYGDPDVSEQTQAFITTAKRIADASALWLVVLWMLIFVAIYPPICVALRSHPAKAVEIDIRATWPRLLPPVIVTLCIIAVSFTFAVAKVSN